MKRTFATLAMLVLVLCSAACGGQEAPLPTATTVIMPPTEPPATPTHAPPASTTTSVVMAATATAAPVVAREVTFDTADGVTLSGTAYGQGTKAVIFSHMSEGNRAQWRDFPKQVAEQGYMTLAFDSRGCGKSAGKFDPPTGGADVQAAIAYMREQGASEFILAGSSLGAMGSSKAAALENPAGLIFLAGTTSWGGLSVSDVEIAAIAAPKLFITSEGDTFVKETQHLFDTANEPKELHIYAGKLHGVFLFDGYKQDLEQRLLDFIKANL